MFESSRRQIFGVLFTLVFVAGLLNYSFRDHWRVAAIEQWLLTPWLTPEYMGSGEAAVELLLCYPMGLAMDRDGSLLISDRGRNRRGRIIWRVASDGIAQPVAGTGRRGAAAAGAALEADFERPEGLVAMPDGSILISDGLNHTVYRVDSSGDIEPFAGTGVPGFSGDGGLATEAFLHRPADIRSDNNGNVFIADVRNHRIRMVDSTGRISTVAGVGKRGFSGDGTLAIEARLDTPWGIAVDSRNRLIIADSANHRVRRVEADGTLTTIAGSGNQGYDGDGGSAREASLNFPEGLAVSDDGSLYIGDEFNHSVRLVDPAGLIWTVVGTGAAGRGSSGQQAYGAPLNDPQGVLLTPDGLAIADGNNGRVVTVSESGLLTVTAGRGETQACTDRW